MFHAEDMALSLSTSLSDSFPLVSSDLNGSANLSPIFRDR